MAAPIYFFAGLTRDKLVHQDKLIRQTLDRYGLLDQFGDVRSVEREVAAWDLPGIGPDGKSSGLLLRAYTRQPDGSMLPGQRQGFFPQLQAWTHVLDANDSQLWLGVDKDQMPEPRDLERRRLIRGYDLELSDGRDWHIPFVRIPPTEGVWKETNLPSVFTRNVNGKLGTKVKQQYRAIFEDTDEVENWFRTNTFLWSDIERMVSLCERVMGLNYRFGRYEQQVLELIDMDNYLSLLAWSIAWPLVDVIAIQKKSQESSESSPPQPTTISPGQPDETPATAPAVAS